MSMTAISSGSVDVTYKILHQGMLHYQRHSFTGSRWTKRYLILYDNGTLDMHSPIHLTSNETPVDKLKTIDIRNTSMNILCGAECEKSESACKWPKLCQSGTQITIVCCVRSYFFFADRVDVANEWQERLQSVSLQAGLGLSTQSHSARIGAKKRSVTSPNSPSTCRPTFGFRKGNRKSNASASVSPLFSISSENTEGESRMAPASSPELFTAELKNILSWIGCSKPQDFATILVESGIENVEDLLQVQTDKRTRDQLDKKGVSKKDRSRLLKMTETDVDLWRGQSQDLSPRLPPPAPGMIAAKTSLSKCSADAALTATNSFNIDDAIHDGKLRGNNLGSASTPPKVARGIQPLYCSLLGRQGQLIRYDDTLEPGPERVVEGNIRYQSWQPGYEHHSVSKSKE